jgi:DNA polymerase/3'-5' exonuclease PolX
MKAKELIYLFNEELAKVKLDKKDSPGISFIIRAYVAVFKQLNDNFHPNDTVSRSKIDALHLTENMKDKLIKLLNNKVAKDPNFKKKLLHNELRRIAGIGSQKATLLIQQGLTSIAQLKQPKWWNQLNLDTQTALATQPLRQIPHNQIKVIEPLLTKFPNAKTMLVGSYRRKMPTSKDIDVMVVSARTSIMNDYLQYLEKKIPHIYVYSKGADKMSIVLEFDKDRKYKVDVFRTHPDFYWSHLLYSSGPISLNIKMRARAKKMGMLLNQKGLWTNGERVLGPNANEHAYFKAVDMPYLPPEKR